MEKRITIEVCANSVESAVAAQKAGAGRIELCSNLLEGGTTPSFASIEITRNMLSIPIHVLIRPRGGDFLYNDIEFSVVERDIEVCKKAGVDGIVVGILDEFGNIDIKRMKKLIDIARPMHVTFHRAFDMCSNPFESLEAVIALGIERILTSGQQAKAFDGIGLISELVKKSAGKIAIMAGGGINQTNVSEIINVTGVSEIHLTGKRVYNSGMKFKNPHIVMGRLGYQLEYSKELTDADKIREIVEIVNALGFKT